MYEHCFRLLPELLLSQLIAPSTALHGFSGESTWQVGIIELELELVDEDNKEMVRSTIVEYSVVRSYSRYNALLGHTTLQMLGAIPSIVHGLVKFPTPLGIAAISSESLDTIYSAVELTDETTKFKLRDILTTNIDVFARTKVDMTGVPREIVEHKLSANPSITPVRQKKRGLAHAWSEWLKVEVDKLVKANILREVRYQTWVANTLLVKTSDGSSQMCVDFTDINKA
ncbi:uncharacterized protein [Rutidosis leptorrhynchoides]|uniref:uncharacterized protein n=1 Tax=Rutidosis leptorrhynchoides TaxID=125765 RepID=UPI003A99D070